MIDVNPIYMHSQITSKSPAAFAKSLRPLRANDATGNFFTTRGTNISYTHGVGDCKSGRVPAL